MWSEYLLPLCLPEVQRSWKGRLFPAAAGAQATGIADDEMETLEFPCRGRLQFQGGGGEKNGDARIDFAGHEI